MKNNPAFNVLLFHCDQLRYDCIGSNGNRYVRTPNIDALATAGTVFSRHIAANTVCMPSRASLLTGLYPPGHGLTANGIALNRKEYIPHAIPDWVKGDIPIAEEPQTLADAFVSAGYHTAAFGKLHLTPSLAPVCYGYPETYACWDDGHLDDWHGPYYGFQEIWMTKGHGEQTIEHGHYRLWLDEHFPDLRGRIKEAAQQVQHPVSSVDDCYPSAIPLEAHNTTWLAEHTARYIAERRRDGKAFFAFVGFPDPHHPFTPTMETWEMFKDAPVHEPVAPDDTSWPRGGATDGGGMQLNLTSEERKIIIRATYAMIYQIDLAVGRIIESLKSEGLWENTVIMFTSDHGDYLCDHGLLRKSGHGCDALLHVPFIMRVPKANLPAYIHTPMSSCDVMPTTLAACGLAVPPGLHGINVLEPGAGHPDRQVYAFTADGNPANNNITIYDHQYRFTWFPADNRTFLFDHSTDHGETRNLSTDRPDLVSRFRNGASTALARAYSPITGRVAPW